jgi:hypothetical protein
MAALRDGRCARTTSTPCRTGASPTSYQRMQVFMQSKVMDAALGRPALKAPLPCG